MGLMPGKLTFRWIGSFWIVNTYNGMYQVGTLAGEILRKWVNAFRLRPYQGPTPNNPFQTNTIPNKEGLQPSNRKRYEKSTCT